MYLLVYILGKDLGKESFKKNYTEIKIEKQSL